MQYIVGIVKDSVIRNTLVFSGDNENEVLSAAKSFVQNGAIEEADEIVIINPEDGFGIGDYYVNGKFSNVRHCAVLDKDDFCVEIKTMPFGYKEGDELDNEIPIVSYQKSYVGAFYDGDCWHFDEARPISRNLEVENMITPVNTDFVYIVRHVATPERVKCVEALKKVIPDLVVLEDTGGKPMETFIAALRYDKNRPIIMLEDDVELTEDFCNKIKERVKEAPHRIINFFGDCGSKNRISKWRDGKHFCWLQCCYFPTGYGDMIADYYPQWKIEIEKLLEHSERIGMRSTDTFFDGMVAHWLASRNERYYISLPALVQHLPFESVVDPTRSKNRQCKSFVK